jgi:hypothetical protein
MNPGYSEGEEQGFEFEMEDGDLIIIHAVSIGEAVVHLILDGYNIERVVDIFRLKKNGKRFPGSIRYGWSVYRRSKEWPAARYDRGD